LLSQHKIDSVFLERLVARRQARALEAVAL
jgi:hypothetical protein